MSTAKVLRAIDDQLEESLDLLDRLVRIPSRRQDGEAMVAAADFLAETVTAMGGKAEVIEWPDSYPYVLGEFRGAQPRRLFMFNHYDVEIEPAPPDSAWTVGGPFDPARANGRIFGRGVADDKGSLVARLACVRAFQRAGVELPVDVTMLFEGKTELHSPGLGSFYTAHRDRLFGLGALWENSFIDGAGRPVLRLGEKGLLYVRLNVRTLTGPASSQFAAVLPSAAWRLVWALAALHPHSGDGLLNSAELHGHYVGTEHLEGFGDLEALPDALRSRALLPLAPLPPQVTDAAAIRTLPTLNVVSLESGGGYRDGVHLAIPGEATAVLEIRLLPGMTADGGLKLLSQYLESAGFGDIGIEVMAASEPHRTDPQDPFVRQVAAAAESAFGVEPVLEPSSMAVGNQGVCGEMPIVGVGVFRADAAKDGVNESIRVDDFRNGIRLIAGLLLQLAAQGDQQPAS